MLRAGGVAPRHTGPMQLRDAGPTDLAAIAPVFRAIVSDGETYCYADDLTDEQIAAEWMPPPPFRCIVALDDDGALLGTAKMGPVRAGRGDHIATAAFMVTPAAQGKGTGRALAEAALRWAQQAGYAGMQFNAVVETNMAAVALWQQLGFRILATIPAAFDSKRHGRVGMHVMYRPLP